MELTVLGADGGWPLTGGATAGYLLRHDGFALWIETGTGTMANIQRHIPLQDVDAIVLSHRHGDHYLDLYPLFLWWRYGGLDLPPMPLFAPPGLIEHASGIEDELREAFDLTEVELGDDVGVGPFRVRTAPMRHPVPTLGMRFEADGAAVAYSADSGPDDALVDLARGADVFLCEATWPAEEVGPPMHLSGTEAGEHATKADVGRLLLTHVRRTDYRPRVLEEASAAYAGPVEVAEAGMRVEP